MSKKIKIILTISLLLNLTIFYVAYKALEYRSHINHFLDKYTNVVNEFSGRHYFEKENKLILSNENNGNRIVLFGTQIIERWQITDTTGKYEIVKRGMSNQRLAGLLLRFKQDVIDLKPKMVLIELSSYNFRPQHSIEEIMDYLTSMAELAHYHNIKPILTTTIPLLKEVDTLGVYSIMDSTALYNNWLRAYANTKDFELIDLNKIFAGNNGYLIKEYAADAIDLNNSGYLIFENELFEILNNN